ncbi:HET-domain-containing protein [Polychaeton citri CBS 116435]|uniref:HET-domain-containing protein n=1 Tax=Polychaeton citri CBS 116435 TaxID=1314669 RepID=A0A9P4Q813_9PEZI|nr:HET-domain-containing protein [Polychaeton citri CBS 116435]
MEICDRCQQIPLETLPRFPSSYTYTGQNIYGIEISYEGGDLDLSDAYILHDSVDDLIASRSGCELCSRIVTKLELFWEANERFESAVWLARPPRVFEKSEIIKSLEYGFVVFLGPCPSDKAILSREGKSLHLIATFGVCVENARPISYHANSEDVISFVKDVLQDCIVRHSTCQKGSSKLPKRVLDVGSTAMDAKFTRLCDTDKDVGIYAALSYCWGVTGEFVTNRDNLGERKMEIPIAKMPKTIRDAIYLARRLDIRYLWVDALCICQDDEGEWAQQAAEMTEVYSNAYVTIAACSAWENSMGCFVSRPKQLTQVELVYDNQEGVEGRLFVFEQSLGPLIEGVNLKLSWEPLSQRAWAFQERVLARRTVLFCSDQVYFECAHGTSAEDGTRSQKRYIDILGTSNPHSSDSPNASPLSEPVWYRMLSDYTSRQLSRSTDKLPAIAGLARIFQSYTQADYVAGLWSDDLVRGLLWEPILQYGQTHTQCDTYIAPSWSWASLEGAVDYFGFAAEFEAGLSLFSVLQHNVQLKTANPFGELTSGWIQLRGPVLPLSLRSERLDNETHLGAYSFKVQSDVEIKDLDFHRDIILDTCSSRFQAPSSVLARYRLSALITFCENASADEPAKLYHFILVGQDATDPLRRSRRLAVSRLYASKDLPDELTGSIQTITLY